MLLLWDKVSNKCALKAAPKTDKNAYAVSVASDRHSGSITAKSFLSHIGWSARKREMLPATWNEKQRILEVTLPPECVGTEKDRNFKRKMTTNP